MARPRSDFSEKSGIKLYLSNKKIFILLYLFFLFVTHKYGIEIIGMLLHAYFRHLCGASGLL